MFIWDWFTGVLGYLGEYMTVKWFKAQPFDQSYT